MKIGILTFHRPANFGANLQAYCSMCYLRSLGYEAKVIDYVRAGDLEYRKQVDAKQYEAHKSFVETRLNLTKQATTSEDLSRIVEEEHFDAIVVGADAVWRSPNDSNIYFAEWLFKSPELSGIPVASISPAHMGDGFTALSDARQEAIKNCLLKFKYITVRDEWTKKVINRDLFNGKEYISDLAGKISKWIDLTPQAREVVRKQCRAEVERNWSISSQIKVLKKVLG